MKLNIVKYMCFCLAALWFGLIVGACVAPLILIVFGFHIVSFYWLMIVTVIGSFVAVRRYVQTEKVIERSGGQVESGLARKLGIKFPTPRKGL